MVLIIDKIKIQYIDLGRLTLGLGAMIFLVA